MDIYEEILKANPDRNLEKLNRRIMKNSEEFGEMVQAYLSLTASTGNPKNKTWVDFLEEAVDNTIVALDIAQTKIPDCTNLSDAEYRVIVEAMFKRKLEKWVKFRNKDSSV